MSNDNQQPTGGEMEMQQQQEPVEVEGGKPRVFVYGTLKRGEANHPLIVAGGGRYVGEETLVGPYCLVDLGYFPGLVRDHSLRDSAVHGEVYEVSMELLASLDILEGHPNFYERSRLTTNKFKNVWVYFLPDAYAAGASARVEGGNWTGA